MIRKMNDLMGGIQWEAATEQGEGLIKYLLCFLALTKGLAALVGERLVEHKIECGKPKTSVPGKQ